MMVRELKEERGSLERGSESKLVEMFAEGESRMTLAAGYGLKCTCRLVTGERMRL